MIPYLQFGRRIVVLPAFILCHFLSAQDAIWTWELIDGADLAPFFSKDFADKQIANESELEQLQIALVSSLHAEGYLGASIDTTYRVETGHHSMVFCGPLFSEVQLDLSSVDPLLLSKSGLGRFKSGSYKLSEIREIIDRLLAYQENNGHPFALASLKPTAVTEEDVAATLIIDANYPVKVDSVNVVGNLKLNDEYLQNYIGIKEGDLYAEAQIADISRRINELPFLEEIRPAQIRFRSNSAQVKMYLNKKNASRFNFVLGLLPDNETGKLQITGDGLVHIVNGFGIGEELRLEYKNFPNSLQEVQTLVVLPYLPFVPVGVELGFNVLLRDTLHRNVYSDVALYYDLNKNGRVKFFWERNETRLLSIDENEIVVLERVPNRLDLTTNYYGVGFNYTRLDYKFNPRSGRNIQVNLALGLRRIFENNTIKELIEDGLTEFNPYAGLNLRNTQTKADWLMQQFIPLKKRSTILTQYSGALTRNLRGGGEDSPNNYYENEQFRIGGNRSLRGFDEESIFSDMYHMLTLEYRYLLSRNSYFFVFSDNVYLTDLTDPISDLESFNYGFGTGFSFETKAGIFGISYALGGSRVTLDGDLTKRPPRFRNGKVHFGYVSYF